MNGLPGKYCLLLNVFSWDWAKDIRHGKEQFGALWNSQKVPPDDQIEGRRRSRRIGSEQIARKLYE